MKGRSTVTRHGWVVPIPGKRHLGVKARCGGPGLCSDCQSEALQERMRRTVEVVPCSRCGHAKPINCYCDCVTPEERATVDAYHRGIVDRLVNAFEPLLPDLIHPV